MFEEARKFAIATLQRIVYDEWLLKVADIPQHCVKSVQIRSFFWCVFSRIRTEYEDIFSTSTYSVRIQKNMDQK